MKSSKRARQAGTSSAVSDPVVRAAREFIEARDPEEAGDGPAAGMGPFSRDRLVAKASADAIMARVRQASGRKRSPGSRVAMMAIAAVLVAALSSTVTIGIIRSSATVEVRFVLSAPEASSVMLAADFNQWTPDGYALRRSPDGHWEITVPLQKGKSYAYNFVIDGERWIVDPSTASRLDDGFGGSSSTISL